LPTNLQNFTQKDLTEVKIFQKVLGATFFETPGTPGTSFLYFQKHRNQNQNDDHIATGLCINHCTPNPSLVKLKDFVKLYFCRFLLQYINKLTGSCIRKSPQTDDMVIIFLIGNNSNVLELLFIIPL